MSGAVDWQMLAANVALQSLVLTGLGWVVVRFAVKDARRRAWMAVLVAVGAGVLPWLSPWMPQRPKVAEAKEKSVMAAEWRVERAWNGEVTPAAMDAGLVVARVEELRAQTSKGSAWWGSFSWRDLLMGCWSLGAVVLGLRLVRRGLLARRWHGELRRLTEEEAERVPTVAKDVMVFEGEGSPCVSGVWRPVVAVPVAMLKRLSAQQWRWVMRHEGAHLLGHDTRVAWQLEMLRVALWWNPFMHGLVSMWTQAREEVCDAVAEQETDRSGYAKFLLEVAEGMRVMARKEALRVQLAMAVSKPAKRLKARLNAIMEQRGVRSRVGGGFALVALLVMGMLMVPVSWLGFGVAVAQVEDVKEDTVGVTPSKVEELQAKTFLLAPNFFGSAADEVNLSVKNRLTEMGVSFPEGSNATWVRLTSQLTVRNTPANLEKLAAIFYRKEKLKEVRVMIFSIKSKFVELPTAVPMPGGITGDVLNEKEFDTVISGLSQKKDIALASMPSVSTRARMEAVVEHTRAISEKDYVGSKQWMWAEYKEGGIELNLTATVATFEGKEFFGFSKEEVVAEAKTTNARVRYLTKRKRVQLPVGYTQWVEMGETAPGKKVWLFVTPEIIDIHGQRVSGEEMQRRMREAGAEDEEMGKGGAASKMIAEATGVDHSKQVRLKMQLIEKPFDPDSLFNEADLGMKKSGGSAEEKGHNKREDSLIPQSIAPASHAVAAVLTEAQAKGILQHFRTLEDVTIYPERVLSVANGKSIQEAVAEQLKRPVGKVGALIGADGRTVDLEVSFPEEPATWVTHSLSVWNAQTACFTDAVVGMPKGQRHQLILITAEF